MLSNMKTYMFNSLPSSIGSFLFGIITCLSLFSCQDTPIEPMNSENGIFEFNFLPRVGGQSFEKDIIFQNVLGQRFSLETFRLYISDLTLIGRDGEDTIIAETLLLDFIEEEVYKTAHGEGIFKQFTVPTGNYDGIRFGIGVPSSRNNNDPTDYPSDHPLSVSQGMHWNWASGYKFVQIDGRIDSSNLRTGPLDLGFIYHTGTNELYREMVYLDSEHAFAIEPGSELQFKMEIDLNRFFYTDADTIDMVQFNTTQTMPPGSEAFRLAEKITNNIVNNSLYKIPF